MPSLTIRRGGGYTDMLRRYKIEIDGKIVGTIRRYEVRIFDIEEGLHKVRMRIDWCGSRIVDLDIGPAGAEMVCTANRLLPWLAIFLIFMPNRWISLEIVDTGLGGPRPGDA